MSLQLHGLMDLYPDSLNVTHLSSSAFKNVFQNVYSCVLNLPLPEVIDYPAFQVLKTEGPVRILKPFPVSSAPR